MVLKLDNINKTYGSHQVLHNVSFTATNKNTLGLLGRNGHGKSTTLKIMMGIISSDSGQVTIDDIPVNTTHFKLGYLPEERGLYQKVKIVEQMVYFGSLRGLTRTAAKKVALSYLERLEMTEYIGKKAGELSKGNQQKIQLAIALMNDPDILILDEPYSGLDPVNSKLLQDIIEEMSAQNKLVIFSSHELGRVEDFCDDIVILNRGQVVIEGNLSDIKKAYPRTEIFVKGTDLDVTGLVALPFKEGYKIPFDTNSAKEAILRQVSAQNLDTYHVLEPTLLQIFLEKVGEESGVEI